MIGGGALALLIIILLVINVMPRRAGPITSSKQDSVQLPVELPAKMSTSTGEMVLVKEGDFLFGEANEKRALKAFYIDTYEVTNEIYKRFTLDRGWPLPDNFPDDEASRKLPVVNLSFLDAREFSIWAGKRVPQSVEWEKAARGPMGRTYPWGYEHLPEMAVVQDNPSLKGLKGPKEVGSWRDSKGSSNAMDLAGNVFEWVDERAKPSAGALRSFGAIMKPEPTEADLWVQIRGGSYLRPLLKNASVEFASVPAAYKASDIGFRCVADVGSKLPATA